MSVENQSDVKSRLAMDFGTGEKKSETDDSEGGGIRADN